VQNGDLNLILHFVKADFPKKSMTQTENIICCIIIIIISSSSSSSNISSSSSSSICSCYR
jgi:hypothetical protein